MQLHLPVRVATQASAGAMSQYRHGEWLPWHVFSSPSPHLNYQLPIATVFSRSAGAEQKALEGSWLHMARRGEMGAKCLRALAA